jgi:ankyrin repeat protein
MGLFGKKYTIETLQQAVLSGDAGAVTACIEKGVDPNGTCRLPPFCIAIMQNNFELVKLLAEKGAKVDPDLGPNSDSTALTLACDSGNEEIVDFLLSKGVDVNKATGTGFTPLWKAAASGRSSICKKLVDKGADAKSCMAALKAFKDAGMSTGETRNVESYLKSIGL